MLVMMGLTPKKLSTIRAKIKVSNSVQEQIHSGHKMTSRHLRIAYLVYMTGNIICLLKVKFDKLLLVVILTKRH